MIRLLVFFGVWFAPWMAMKRYLTICLGLGLTAAELTVGAEEKLAVLKVGDEVYRNVTVTGTNATDLYFKHAGGIGNAKLKKLEPELQKHFHFDAAKAGAAEKKQFEANAQYHEQVSTNKPAVRPAELVTDMPPPIYDNGDVVAPKLYARSFRGTRPPKFAVKEWVTPAPDSKDLATKSVLVVFWMTWAAPCRAAVPRLNNLATKFRDRLVIICLSSESAEDIRKAPGMTVGFHVGADPEGRTIREFGVEAVPHAVLIDTKGIVRYEGRLGYLDDEAVEHLLTRYSQ